MEASAKRSRRLLLVDDHAVVRESLRVVLLDRHPDLAIDEAGDCVQALNHARDADAYDLILLDLNMPGVSGIAALDAVREAFPASPVIVVSAEENFEIVMATVEHGAAGFVSKRAPGRVLLDAIDLRFEGGVSLPPSFLAFYPLPQEARAETARGSRTPADITGTELKVLGALVANLANKEIARALNMGDSNVKRNVEAIFRKLGIHRRADAMVLAQKNQWLLPVPPPLRN